MTGAGSSSVAFVKETSFDTLPGTPTYYLPGRNISARELSLDNVLQRMREPASEEAVDSLAGNLDGALGVDYAMSADTHTHVRDIVFNDGGGGFISGHATTSSWYTGVEYLDSISTTATAERHLKGCIPLEYSISYEQGTNTINESLTMGYTDEEFNTSLTPGTITGPTDGNDVPFHGTDLTVDSTGVGSRLQSATLSFQNMYRFIRGTSRSATDATLANPETSLEMASVFNTSDRLQQAYGGSSATSPQDQLANVTGSLAFNVAGSTVATYSLPKLKPANYDWDSLVSPDDDLTDPINYHVNGGVSIA